MFEWLFSLLSPFLMIVRAAWFHLSKQSGSSQFVLEDRETTSRFDVKILGARLHWKSTVKRKRISLDD